MPLPPEALADRALEHVLGLPGRRKLIAVAGAPGAGKSTIAAMLCDRLAGRLRGGAVVPMDGFHLDNDRLREMGLLDRKGAPETFDAAGFIALVRRIAQGAGDVSYPLFDRARDLSIADAATLSAEVEFVVFEGNYLLLDEAPWRDLAPFWTSTIWVDVPLAELESRLMQRWLDAGMPMAEARVKVAENDMPNARLVCRRSRKSHLILEG